MKYLLILTNAPDTWAMPADVPGVSPDFDTYTLALRDAGVLVTGFGLHDPETSTSVRVRDGRPVLLDGPFAETKEHIVGFYVIEVDDLDAALAWAARVPNVHTGTVEVRPIRPDLEVEATLARA